MCFLFKLMLIKLQFDPYQFDLVAVNQSMVSVFWQLKWNILSVDPVEFAKFRNASLMRNAKNKPLSPYRTGRGIRYLVDSLIFNYTVQYNDTSHCKTYSYASHRTQKLTEQLSIFFLNAHLNIKFQYSFILCSKELIINF